MGTPACPGVGRNYPPSAAPIDGDRKLPVCATRDIAATAATLLLDPFPPGADEGHVAVLGPEDLSFNDMARIMSEVLHKPVHFQQISFEAYKSRFIELGMSDAMAQGMTDTTPTRFRQWCKEELRPAVLG